MKDKSIRTIILIVVETSGLPSLGQNRVLVHLGHHHYNNNNHREINNRYNNNSRYNNRNK